MMMIENIESRLFEKYRFHEFAPEVIKQGPVSKGPDFHDIVLRTIRSTCTGETAVYIKGFTKSGETRGKKERALIELFNEFCEKEGLSFSGPEILSEETDPCYHFVMRDLERDGYEKVDFPKTEAEELLQLYAEYRAVFDEFENAAGLNYSTEHQRRFNRLASRGKYLERKFSVTLLNSRIGKYVMMKKIKKTMLEQIANRVKTHEQLLHQETSVEHDEIKNEKKEIAKKTQERLPKENVLPYFEKLQSKVESLTLSFDFHRLWTGHLFKKDEKRALVDFDAVGYYVEGTELVNLLWSKIFLPVVNYESYDDRKKIAWDGYVMLKEQLQNEDVARLLLFEKLVATIYTDFGDLMITNQKNRTDIEQLGKAPKDNALKGVEWNVKFLNEVFEDMDM